MPFTGYEMEENETEETGFFEENASIKSEDSVSSSVLSLEGDRKETIINLQSKEAVLRAIHDGEDGVDRCPVCAWELEDGECAQCGPQFDDNGTTSWKNSIDNFSDMDETSEHGMSGEEVGNKKEDKGLPKTFQEAPIPQVNIWKQRAESKAAKSKVSNATPANKPAASVAKSPAQNSPNKAGDATANSARKGKDFSANGGYQNLRDGGHENEGDEGEEPRPGVQPVSSTLGAGSTTSTNPQASTNMESTIVPPTTGEVGHFDIGSTTENDENKQRPPPTVTQPSTNSSYRPTAAASRPPDNKLQDPKQAATREQLRRERQADEFWAQYHRDRQERREGRKMNEQSHPADDWEARLEEGRRRVEQEHRDRQQETRHNPSINAAPADISEDEDWGAQLEEGRRRLAELRRTEETAASDARTVNDPLRRRNTTGIGENGQLDRLPGVTSDSSSAPRPISERHGADAILASQIADAQADIQRAEARIAARRDREQRERMVEA
ncbi:hypothetical protein DBV05_g3071 [Lasiodiplodia theobromae]|uniref:Uncharacterized protein n=1 Tax=Lasiodiplodia theobromae TaxID=45133 RepID=A0A5N5DNN6_9PEZI|nr:hypothetical protein DBV05_g3071 [Lasiodiplodia theobromae]